VPQKLYGVPLALAVLIAVVAGVVVWGGRDASAGPDGFPFITATQASYAPTGTAVILGYEFQPGQTLTVKITRPDGSVVKANGKRGSDTVVTDSLGQFVYNYPPLGIEGLYYVDAMARVSTGKGGKTTNVVLASTVFEDNITTDLELVGMPDACAFINPCRDGPRDGLVDAIAGKCLVGTVDIGVTGQTNDIRGFFFDLVVDDDSGMQPSSAGIRDFIDQLETVSTRATADPDTGSAPAPGPSPFYTTSFAGHTVIAGTSGTPFAWTALDGTKFEVVGPSAPVSKPNSNEVTYRVTISNSNASALTSARFEYCARLDPLAGDADNGTDGFITSNPETGGTEASPINVIRVPDDSPPICEVTFVTGGIDVFVQDPESGIQSIVVVSVVNATVTIPSFTPGTTDPIIVEARKIDPNAPSSLALRITNGAGLITECDPVDFTLIRGDGQPVINTFSLGEREGYLRIDNSGLQQISINLNGNYLLFSANSQGEGVYQMAAWGVSTFDLTSYLVAGENSISITAMGSPGGSARISIHD